MDKRYSEHKDSEIAKDILINAIHLATETNHPKIQTESFILAPVKITDKQ